MNKVKVYSQVGCGPCIVLKRFLDSKGVTYEAIDIRGDETARNHIVNLGYQGTPVLEIDGVGHTGGAFNPMKVDALLKEAR